MSVPLRMIVTPEYDDASGFREAMAARPKRERVTCVCYRCGKAKSWDGRTDFREWRGCFSCRTLDSVAPGGWLHGLLMRSVGLPIDNAPPIG
jgi:CRISPR/Cas system-associated protein Cas10 (large subunit of type III CRISPR-Cas system)